MVDFEEDVIDPSGATAGTVLRRQLPTGVLLVRDELQPGLLPSAYSLLERFFALPHAVKQRWSLRGSDGQHGYTSRLDPAAPNDPDWKEVLAWGAELPPGDMLAERFPARYARPFLDGIDVPGLATALATLHAQLLASQLRVLRLLAPILEVDAPYVEDLVRDGPHLCRAVHYPVRPPEAERRTWAAAHVDLGLVTLLPAATGVGLQVHLGTWRDVTPRPGCSVLLVGAILERLTNGWARAATHRVQPPAGGDSSRLAVLQFCHPRPTATIAPLRAFARRDAQATATPADAGTLFEQLRSELRPRVDEG